MPRRHSGSNSESQRHEILHRFLAEIMIDAVDLFLGKHRADLDVDQIRRFRVMTQGLFQHHARQRCYYVGFRQILADYREQI
jgi:hypothetical protein